MCDKRRQKKTHKKRCIFPKVNIYHDQLYEDKRKTSTNKSFVCADQKKKRSIFCMIWKQKENVDQKNTIVQMKEKKKKLILKIETSYT